MERISREVLMKGLSTENRKTFDYYLQKGGALMYRHNGADVMITKSVTEGGNAPKTSHHILIAKDDRLQHFYTTGGIGNEAGTFFLSAGVFGLECRTTANGDPREGMYPYDIILPEEKEKDADLLTYAAKVYQRYQDETNGEVNIGDIFKSYVPGSFESIRENLNTQDKQKEDQVKQTIIDAKMEEFKNNLKGW